MPDSTSSEPNYNNALERYLAGKMSVEEEKEFYLQVALDPQLQEILRAYHAVEKSMRAEKEQMSSAYLRMASTRPDPATATIMAMQANSSKRGSTGKNSKLASFLALLQPSWVGSATGGVAVGIKATAVALLVCGATATTVYIVSGPSPAPPTRRAAPSSSVPTDPTRADAKLLSPTPLPSQPSPVTPPPTQSTRDQRSARSNTVAKSPQEQFEREPMEETPIKVIRREGYVDSIFKPMYLVPPPKDYKPEPPPPANDSTANDSTANDSTAIQPKKNE